MQQYPVLLNLTGQTISMAGRVPQRRSVTAAGFASELRVVIDPYKNLRAVAANGLDRATFHRLFAERFFLRRFRLFVYVGMSTVVVTTEVRGRGFTTKIAVYALVVDVELSFDILGIFICGVGHFLKLVKTSGKVG